MPPGKRQSWGPLWPHPLRDSVSPEAPGGRASPLPGPDPHPHVCAAFRSGQPCDTRAAQPASHQRQVRGHDQPDQRRGLSERLWPGCSRATCPAGGVSPWAAAVARCWGAPRSAVEHRFCCLSRAMSDCAAVSLRAANVGSPGPCGPLRALRCHREGAKAWVWPGASVRERVYPQRSVYSR